MARNERGDGRGGRKGVGGGGNLVDGVVGKGGEYREGGRKWNSKERENESSG